MVRGLGAALLAAGCAWVGFRAAAGLTGRVRALEDMAAGLLLLEQELELDSPPLPILLERLSGRTGGPAAVLFAQCRAGLDRLGEESFSAQWRRLVLERRELGEEGRRCLLPLGDTLGRCGGGAQVRGVEAAVRRLDGAIAQAREEARQQRKLYQALGLSGGAFLVILLL